MSGYRHPPIGTRYASKWSVERALTEPVRHGRPGQRPLSVRINLLRSAVAA